MRQRPYKNADVRKFVSWACEAGFEIESRGWPDFICSKGPKTIVVKILADNHKLRAHHTHTLSILARLGVEVCVWYPSTGFKRLKTEERG